MDYTKITSDERNLAEAQRAAYIELRDIARNQSENYESELNWEVIKGKEYLVRILNGHKKILGTRAPHIEDFYNDYTEKRTTLNQRITHLKAIILDCKCKILKTTIARVPQSAAQVLRKLDKEGALGTKYTVSGLQCIYAYESQANIRFKQTLKDRDIYNISKTAAQGLVLIADYGAQHKLFKYLREIDPTYKMFGDKGRFRMINKDKFYIDLICNNSNEQSAWMMKVPRIETISFCDSGLPVPFTCLAPHVFAVYKYWQAQNHKNNHQQTKASIDSKQAYAITEMVSKELGRCITEEDYSSVPECISEFKEQLAAEAHKNFSGAASYQV